MTPGLLLAVVLSAFSVLGTVSSSLRRPKKNSIFAGIFHQTTPVPFGCRRPRPGEKVIYMVVHGVAKEVNDGELTDEGKDMAKSLRDEPKLAFALSTNATWRAQAIMTAPSRKCLQTALLGFRDVLPDARWIIDPDIKGKGDWNDAIPEKGLAMLNQMHVSPQMKQDYRENWDHKHMGTHADRFTRFVKRLREMPETNIIVIATDYEAHLAGTELGCGESNAYALTQDASGADKHGWGAFRLLSKPQRWADCPLDETMDEETEPTEALQEW